MGSGRGYDNTIKAFQHSLKELNTDYIDLYLIHQPYGDYYGSWRVMEKFMHDGYIRAIGVSNFTPERIVDLCLNSDFSPMVNQLERHPYFLNKEALFEMQKNGVAAQAWGPLCEGQKDIFGNQILNDIAAVHGKSAAQLILKWNLQSGVAVIPCSTSERHRLEKISLDDFELSDEEMQLINSMDLGHSEIIDHRCGHTARQLINWRIHD